MTQNRGLVLHVAYDDTDRILKAVRSAKNARKALGDDVVIDIIAQNASVKGALKTDPNADEIASMLAELPGVTIHLCRMAVEGNGIDEADLIDGVEVTPTASAFAAQRQFDGYAYVRV